MRAIPKRRLAIRSKSGRSAESGALRTLTACCWIVILMGQMIAPPAFADTGTCTASASNIAFGPLTINSLLDATATSSESVTCPSGHGSYNPWAYCISIGAGSNSTSASNRTMKSGSNTIQYNLYSDSGYTKPFTYIGSVIYTYPYSNGSGSTAPSTIYAMILSPTTGIPPGTYTDSYTSSSQAIVNSNGAPTTYSVAETCTGTTGANWYNTLQFSVSVTLQPSCTMSVAGMNFGTTPAPIANNVTTTANITATCTYTTPYSIGLDNGLYASGGQRRMKSTSGYFINYNLYVDSGYTEPWSAASSSTTCSNGAGTCELNTGTGSNQNITVYGLVAPQASPTVGSYSDTVVVTLTY